MGAPYVLVILKFCRRIVDPTLAQLRDFRSASISGGEMTLWVTNCLATSPDQRQKDRRKPPRRPATGAAEAGQ
jgi:hypothetical protein